MKPKKTTKAFVANASPAQGGSQCHTEPEAPASALCPECGQPDPLAALLAALPEICARCGQVVPPQETDRKSVQPRRRPKRATTWSAPADWSTVCRRAAGRRAYNARRSFMRAQRRWELVQALRKYRGPRGFLTRGVQTELAAALGVHRSTICRDIKALLAEVNAGRPCPLCGCQMAHRW